MRIGPITILTTKKAKAYENVHKQAAYLHRLLWYSDDWSRDREELMEQVMELGGALSYLPDPFN